MGTARRHIEGAGDSRRRLRVDGNDLEGIGDVHEEYALFRVVDRPACAPRHGDRGEVTSCAYVHQSHARWLLGARVSDVCAQQETTIGIVGQPIRARPDRDLRYIILRSWREDADRTLPPV